MSSRQSDLETSASAGVPRSGGALPTLSIEQTTLSSGVRVVTDSLPDSLATGIGVWIRVGSRGESDSEAGLSHLLEHMLFRGTENFESTEIDQRFDALGGDFNAATGRDETGVFARVLADDVPDAFAMIADMVARPLIREDDLEIERQIVLEEIAMIDDTPEELVFELLPQAVFGSHALGRPVIGSPKVVETVSADNLAAYRAGRYQPSDIVVAAGGCIDHAQLVAMAEEQFGPKTFGSATSAGASIDELTSPEPTRPGRMIRQRATEQVQVTVAGRGLPMGDDRRFAMRVLDTILGGTSSSRLFQAIREDRGLAYSVSSFDESHHGGGIAGIYLGTRPENLKEAFSVMADELEKVRQQPISAEEIDRSRRHVRSRLLLGLESGSARMHAAGRATLHGLPILSPQEISERIDSVTAEDLQSLAADLFSPQGLSVAAVGPDAEAIAEAAAVVAPNAEVLKESQYE